MAIKWHIETRKISELKDYHKNPRILTKDQEDQLVKSLQKFGLIDKPIINTDNTIVGGHQRKRVLKKLGQKEIECMVPDRTLNEREIEELNIRLNKNSGEWDWDVLANEWELEDLLSWGFSADELLGDIGDIEDIETEEMEEEDVLAPGEDKDAKTKLGDIYELNGHRIICGDSTDENTVKCLLLDSKPIIMITDPPYGVEYDPKWRQEVKGRHGSVRAVGAVQNDGQVNWSKAWSLFPGSIAYIWHAAKHSAEVEESITECNFGIVSQIIWAKQHFALSRGDYHWQHEPCWYAVKDGHPHNWQGARDQATIWNISNLNAFGKSKADGEERTAHSTQKPVECMARPIKNNTAPGEAVYDPFIGSGTTLIAAEQLGRTCFGVELSPAYCDIIVERWKKYMLKSGKEMVIKINGIEENQTGSCRETDRLE